MNRRLKGRASEAGYAAIMIAILLPVVFMGMAAIGVDVARWYVEVERVQKAADAGSLAGVPYMPHDLAKATTTARSAATQNAYNDTSSTVSVSAAQGPRPSQLRVTVSSTIDNTFGRLIGVPSTTITRSAMSDFTGPAPMGSPCNTFGNEPPSQAGAAQPAGSALPVPPYPNCSSQPNFWAAVEGPVTTKGQGDRYSTLNCGVSGVYGCDSAKKNTEYLAEGYFFLIKVQPAAVNNPIRVQLYDPQYAHTNVSCGDLPANSGFTNNMNPYVTTDGKARYLNAPGNYCSGDYLPGSDPFTTSFALREQNDSQDPMKGAVISGCVKQYRGRTTVPSVNSLKSSSGSYNDGLAQVFHSWVDMCTFTPTRDGDYYLQVRTNVSLGGTAQANTNGNTSVTYSDNVAAGAATGNTLIGEGVNSFGIRAVPTPSTLAGSVSVAGWARMPILQNAPSSTATFNLIRALPAAAGQFIEFDFFDGGDCQPAGSCSGTIQVLRPTDATGSITGTTYLQGCKGTKNRGTYSNLTNCSVTVANSTHNGQLQSMAIPIPMDYNCNSTSIGGCWFLVKMDFVGATVTDITTWDGSIGGDPVRLVE